MWCEGSVEREKGRRETVHNALIIHWLATPIRLHHRGHIHSPNQRRIEHQKKQQTEYDVIIAKRMSEKKARVAAVKAPYNTVAPSIGVLDFRFSCGRICQSHAVSYRSCPSGDKFIPLRPDDIRDVAINWKMPQTWKGMEAGQESQGKG
ncbi:hypothetical protein FIBSPDRAFT_317275 [Athelia psychrophila]|uniref:Uncharacterized protein n=1 Tax=Athelia psychrophila TaxID=1759441 RepID=A0A167WVP5_9AGAM|nr:hypothetical protein FIBSPDRAFT_317275 [Fibularhizoctonia sp. CBS 109695]